MSSNDIACISQVGIDIDEIAPTVGIERVEATTLELGKEPSYSFRACRRSALGTAGMAPWSVAGFPQTGHLSGKTIRV